VRKIDKEGINKVMVGIIFLSLFAGFMFSATSMGEKQDKIEDLEQDIKDWKNKYDDIKESLDNIKIPECPPATIVWNNQTEYVYETIWQNKTIYIDNAIFDVNRDGVVDYYDTCEVLWYIKHGKSLAEQWVFQKYGNPYEKLYDVNRDGCVDTSDIDAIWANCDVYPPGL